MEALILKLSYRNLAYWNIDIENIEPANRIKQQSQIHIEPALRTAF